MIVKLLTEHHLEFLSLTGGCRGPSESTLVKMSNCWKSHALALYQQGTAVFITTTCLLASVLCVRINPNASGRRKQPPKYISQEVIHAISGKAPAVGVDLCKPCIDLIDNLINQLLNILLSKYIGKMLDPS